MAAAVIHTYPSAADRPSAGSAVMSTPLAAPAVGTPEQPQPQISMAQLQFQQQQPQQPSPFPAAGHAFNDAHERAAAKAQQAQVAIVLCSTAILLGAAVGGFVLVYFQSVLIPFTIAVFMSYLIEPLVQLIMRLIGCATSRCWCCSCCRVRAAGGR